MNFSKGPEKTRSSILYFRTNEKLFLLFRQSVNNISLDNIFDLKEQKNTFIYKMGGSEYDRKTNK